jgi:uncharacterized protein YqjF (DUF2071 family)
MKTNQKEDDQEANKKIALWTSEKVIIKLLLECIIYNYRIAIDNQDGLKVWIENQTEETKLDDTQKQELLKELIRHIK